jgi:hypothetical protein
MPPINDFKCNTCKFKMPRGSGGYIYVKNERGDKVLCPHPDESITIAKVLGINEGEILGFPWFSLSDQAPKDLIEQSVGFNSHCVCLDCLFQFDLDVEKENRECPKYKSSEIRTEVEIVGENCPKCKVGIIKEIRRGL